MSAHALDRSDTGRAVPSIGSPAFLEDPYPTYAACRAGPPFRDERLGGWVLTRYGDISAALAEPRLSSTGRVHALLQGVAPERVSETRWVGDHFDRTLPFLAPPRHTVIRSLLMQALTPRAVSAMRPGIADFVTRFLDTAPDDRFDLATRLTLPLPMAVISLLLGVPQEDRDLFLGWTADVFAIFRPAAEVPNVLDRVQAGLRDARTYLVDLVAVRRADPGTDLISRLIGAEDEAGRKLDEDDIVANCLTLFTAGHETTQGLLGNGALALLDDPTQLGRARATPGMLASAIEEMLRYDSPLQRGWRVASADIDIGGVRVGSGELVFLFIGSANRDATQFPDPDLFDVGRHPNRHLAFGHGPHFCIGAGLARLEASVVFETLLARYPRLRRAHGPAVRRPDMTFRILSSLPVEVS